MFLGTEHPRLQGQTQECCEELIHSIDACIVNEVILWHPVGTISSASGVQQGDPLGPLLFALVLQSVLRQLAADPQCQQLLFNAWYLDDGALAGPGSAVLRALEVLGTEGKPNGLILNQSKCELFSPNADTFQRSTPAFLHQLHLTLKFWGHQLEVQNFALCDPQVSILLLCHCASFCKLFHLGCSIPPCDSSLQQFTCFDEDVLHCLEECAAFELPHSATKQVQLPLRFGGLGLRSVSNHSPSAYIASVSNAIDITNAPNVSQSLKEVIAFYNSKVDPADAMTFESVTSSPPQQHHLSACLSPQLEKGPGIDFSRPADALVPNWSLSHPAAFDLQVIHPLNTDLILEASLASGNSAECGEVRKHAKNDEMCSELGWTCIPLVVEVYGGWGCEAQECFSRLSKRLAMQMGLSDNEALSQIYCLLGVTLMRQNARAILLRCFHIPPS
ncbi:hypothetical protein EMCRGX_G011229 [Ephydatia muelleri]